jgi:ribosome-associated toxin RatA of RatAB toxin-antitoxin module
MSEYERSSTIQASPQTVFDFVANVENLPRIMPTTESAQLLGADHVRIEGEVKGHSYSADGYFHADPSVRRLEWKADEGYYDGWL